MEFSWHYAWWIPLTILRYVIMGWLAVKCNTGGDWRYFLAIIIIQCLPFFTIVSFVSKNIIFDTMAYNVILFLSISLSVAYFSDSFHKFSPIQFIGLILCITGFVLMQIRNTC